MKAIVTPLLEALEATLEIIDIDNNQALQAQYNTEIPVLFIDGRKAFKYRVTTEKLLKYVQRRSRVPS